MEKSTYVLSENLLASGNKRFFNYLVDYVITYIIAYLFGYALQYLIILLDSFGITGFGIWYFNSGTFTMFLIGLLLTLIYYFLMEMVWGRSVGKFVTGTIVVDENGVKPDAKVILKRTLCRCIPFDALTFFGGSRGWHDSISDTYVVNKKELDEEMNLFQEFNLIGQKELI